ncbi:hypothetical protein NG895_25920 [Aeoliella sp. ICT_H6.2]|uniref:Uncharacterized protein n=1 Tax=Aeoliella straminimaris TaxID=2954799 RepID=A0A9X2JKT5_9BACT|nr:hypothetical protein [Aeoliella straminimaris]MCO6047354.1 hypothetical protein [Aeoliella straminimaris]
MRALFSIVGYVSTATLIAAALGLLYLWNTHLLTNEKMFHILALMHDIDLEEIAEESKVGEVEVPREEASMADMSMMREIKLRDYEVRMHALKVGTQEFERSFRDINEGRQRYDQMANELQQRLHQQKQLASEENLAAVVSQLQSIRPTEAKKLLLQFLEEPGGERDVIVLMKEMQPSRLQKILSQFKTDEELEQYHKLLQLMLDGYPEGPEIENMLDRLRIPEDED